MAGTAPAGAGPDTPPKDAPSRAPEESIEAAQRLQRVRANLRLPDRPFAAPSADHDAGLRALRLLDFVRLELPSSGVPRPDVVAELIANYSDTRGRSSVRGRQIEVSLESFTKALRLPPHGAPAGSVADGAAVASASRELAKVYIGAPAEASSRRLPRIFFEKNLDRGPEYTTELLWELVKQEMEHLIESESTDWVSYYGAFLQRLIWVEMPQLFQPARELLSVAAAPPALSVRKEEQGNNENQKCCSECDMDRSEASSKQIIDTASKEVDLASQINIAVSKTIETTSKQLDARRKQHSEKDGGEMQAMESLLGQALVTKERETNDIDRSEASSKQIDTASKEIDLASQINIAASKMIESTSKQLDARMKHLSEKDDNARATESLLDQALVTNERETNDTDRSEASPKQIDMASKKIDSASKKRKQRQPHKERRSPRLAGK